MTTAADWKYPKSDVLERLVLATILTNKQALGASRDLLEAADFWAQTRSTLFDIVSKLPRADLVIAREAVTQHPNEKTAASLLEEINFCLSTARIIGAEFEFEDYCSELRERRLSRELMNFSEWLMKSGHEGIVNGSAWNEQAEAEFGKVFSRRKKGSKAPEEFGDVLAEADAVLEAPEGSQANFVGSTGLIDLDRVIGQLARGDLYIIAARPAMGKSALAFQIAMAIAIEHRVLVWSYEMSRAQLAHRALSHLTGVPSKRIASGHLDPKERAAVKQANLGLRALNLRVINWESKTIEELRAKARSEVRDKGPVGLIVADYVQLMEVRGRSSNQDEKLSNVVNGLKGLATEFNCAVIAVSSLNREVERREDKRPNLSDMRECGAIEYAANTVIGLYREEYYRKEECAEELRGVAEAIVMKQRNGQTGTVRLRFEPTCTTFLNLEQGAAQRYALAQNRNRGTRALRPV
jgi:replicative DNA helicase